MLPNALCLHLKRFEQVGNERKKIDDFVSFPQILNFSPYLSSTILGKRDGKTQENQTKIFYELFAVVNHMGNLDNGHYICYVKHCSEWYKCDDHLISRVSLSSVKASNAYLLFYMRKHVQYN